MRDIEREPITETVVEQLADVVDAGTLDDPYNWTGAQFAARDLGHDELARFIVAADASTYREAVERALRRRE